MYAPDELDFDIIRALNKSARQSYRELARRLTVSIATVSNRIKRLEAEGIIRGYFPDVDLERLGYDLQVVIGVRISHGRLIDVQKKLSKHPNVYGVYDITGDWDSIVLAKFRNRTELNAFIKRLVAMEHIERTNTQVVLNIVKDEKRAQL